MAIVLILVGLVVLVGVIYILMRNSIIASRNRVDEAWSGSTSSSSAGTT